MKLSAARSRFFLVLWGGRHASIEPVNDDDIIYKTTASWVHFTFCGELQCVERLAKDTHRIHSRTASLPSLLSLLNTRGIDHIFLAYDLVTSSTLQSSFSHCHLPAFPN